MTDRARALKRIRRAITQAIQWSEAEAFKGSYHPDQRDYIEDRAKLARRTLDRVIQEELENAYRKAD